MIFDEADFSLIQTNPIIGILKVCKSTFDQLSDSQSWSEHEVECLLHSYALISSAMTENGLHSQNFEPQLNGQLQDDGRALIKWLQGIQDEFSSVGTQLKLAELKARYAAAIGATFAYEFSQGDLDRVQTLINELREELGKSVLFEAKHKARLLERLERLQQELHKKMSDLDRFWGLVGDAGVVLGKFGNDSKPFVERIKEIADIVWRTQARKEELPSATPSPVLPPPSQPV